jgi:hypothetical protein
MSHIFVFGAERQAATSIACAYPHRKVTFVSDHTILDGDDLPNVRMVFATPGNPPVMPSNTQYAALCPRWLMKENPLTLSGLFKKVERGHPGIMLPVCERPASEGRWILKGDRWHRPDAPLSGTARQLEDATDRHGCGLVYQPLVESLATIMAIGRRAQGTQVGCLRIFDERFFWDNILQAAETVDAPDVLAATLEVLDALEYQGFFTLNWLRTVDGLRLSSLRPVPRAIFQMFLRGGVDLMDDPDGVHVVVAGLRMIATPTYVSYRRIEA